MQKKVLITGGNKGIGLETAKIFLKMDYDVFVVARDFKNFELGGLPNITEIEADLSNLKTISDISSVVGDVDVLVNNAGFMQSHIAYNQYSHKEREKIMNVNLYAPIELMNTFSEKMKDKGSGRVVNVSSVAGHTGHPDIWYGITKAGLINATKSYAKLLGSKGIIINCVAPSPTQTNMTNFTYENENNQALQKRVESFKESVITNRLASANEIARTIVWLGVASPEYINGTCIDVNNGSFPR